MSECVVELDLWWYGVRVNGKELKCGPIVRKFFHMMCLRTGTAVSYADIMDFVYADALDEPFQRVLSTFLCNLKKALRVTGFPVQQLQTVHGYGFRLKGDGLKIKIQSKSAHNRREYVEENKEKIRSNIQLFNRFGCRGHSLIESRSAAYF